MTLVAIKYASFGWENNWSEQEEPMHVPKKNGTMARYPEEWTSPDDMPLGEIAL